MSIRFSASIVVVVLIAAAIFDLTLRVRLAAVESATRQTMEEVVLAERASTTAKRQSDTARAPANPARQPIVTTSPSAKPDPVAERTTMIARDPQLRQLSVQAYVSQLRMNFHGLLHRLGLTPGQLNSFDAIQAEYQQGMLDLAASMMDQGITAPKAAAGLRKQLTDTRDARLRELLGDSYRDWVEANRTQGARSNVNQLLQQSFDAGGPVDGAQSEKLVAIVAKHQIPKSGGRFDWTAIRAETAQVLSGPQLEAFNSATSAKELSQQIAEPPGPRR
jgi:hypothetical protein